ncbi:MAG: CvpA family protein [Proteobacteria bacterium]|nr:CvpA family protein [Pseudomonadota bacterium]
MPHTAVDIIVIAVILISAVLAFIRGLTREVLSLGTWLLAIYLAFTQYGRVTPWLVEKITNPVVRDFVGGLIIFAAIMIVLLPIGFYVRGFIKGEQITAVDRSLGFVFGAGRGYVLMAILYLIVAWLLPEEKQPAWLKEANTRPALAYGADVMRDMIPAEQRALLEKKAHQAEENASKESEEPPPEEDKDKDKSKAPTLDGKVDQLDRVIQQNSGKP